MASLIALPFVYSIDRVKSKRKQKEAQRNASTSTAGSSSASSPVDPSPSYSSEPTPAQQDYERQISEQRARDSKAREAYEEYILNSATNAEEEEEEERQTEENREAPPPYTGEVPAYGQHRQDTVLMSNRDRSTVHPALRSSLDDNTQERQEVPERQVGELVDRFERPSRPRGRIVTLSDGRQVEVSPERPGETVEQRRKRKYKEFWSLKGGMFWSLFGVNMVGF